MFNQLPPLPEANLNTVLITLLQRLLEVLFLIFAALVIYNWLQCWFAGNWFAGCAGQCCLEGVGHSLAASLVEAMILLGEVFSSSGRKQLPMTTEASAAAVKRRNLAAGKSYPIKLAAGEPETSP